MEEENKEPKDDVGDVNNVPENEDTSFNKNKTTVTDKVRKNPWIVSTLVFGVLALILLISNFSGGITGNVVSGNDVGELLVNYLSLVGYEGFEVSNVQEINNLYLINTTYQGEEVPFYVTKTGYIVGNSLVSIIPEETSNSKSQQEDIPQSDVPTADLYIWSYCPYGITALGPFAETASLLGDSADFKVYLYYAGHGDFELQQNKIQACIQDLGYKQQYWDYAESFVDNIYEKCYGDIDCDLKESVALMDSLGIDSDKVLECVDSKADSLLEEDSKAASDAGVTGSPTLVVNGVKANVARTADAFKNAVCSGFNEAPEACGEELSTTGTTASGSC